MDCAEPATKQQPTKEDHALMTMTGTKPSLQIRAFTSVLIAMTFTALVLSGAILFLSPPGRVANWSDWRMLGLTKRDWTGLHVWFSAVFLIAAGLHLVFNVRPLVNYFKDRLTRRIGFRREWVAAAVLCGVVFAGTRAGVPPFSSFLDFNERIKKSWEDPRGVAPIPHAELLTLKELAEKAKVPLNTALQRLGDKSVQGATADIVVSKLASQNDLSAQRIYEMLQGVSTRTGRGQGGKSADSSAESQSGEAHRGGGGGGGGRGGWGGGGGPGSMTLTEFCQSKGIDVKEAQARLEAKGIKLTAGRTLRDIAGDNGYERPYELMDIIQGNKK
jgi:uncharacterized membrane protein YgcG